jgi:ADP-heptose:LPS heptosyltransferase/glycosyltransferase involved in cell wall biosynthesis/SAM-dependent methyltransferase
MALSGSTAVLASCIMPTANRRRFVPSAIAQFLAQDYPSKELVILDDGDDSVADLIPSDAAVRYLRTPRHQNLGAKRNAACEAARGDIILHWDDDDWYAPNRIRLQAEALCESDAELCGIDRVLFVDPRARTAWEYVYPSGGAPWVCGATLCYRRDFWRAHPFSNTNNGEDTRFAAAVHPDRLHVLPDNHFFVGLIHAGNSSPKHVRDRRWQRYSFDEVRAITGPDWPPAVQPTNGARAHYAEAALAALVTAASGIGDILRVTPLIRVLHHLGHAVDVLIAPDNAEAADLLRGAPEIRELFVTTDTTNGRIAAVPDALRDRGYALATFSRWSAPLASKVEAKRVLHFQPETWLAQGDSACVAAIARSLGWQGAMPEPFAVASDRDFALPRGTVALHPGCKREWTWKKWHDFDALARRLVHVAVIGTEADLDNAGTYFGRPFEWPDHVRNYVGKLKLADTAALIQQCAALVSNDSGLMHLGVALGVPTFGVFGITSPAREAIPSSRMVAISRELPCEPDCRRQPWGRKDCERHLACLKTLSADDVVARIADRLPEVLVTPVPPNSAEVVVVPQAPAIRVAYYGAVFDASGYGAAAREYIRALHSVGIKVSVIDTGARPAQVEDPLVRSLLGTDPEPDFHLFHGVPPSWARYAYRLRNVIALTVWETDTMPGVWRNPLTHAVDVWLPCRFNVEVFARALGRQPFRLPHPVPLRPAPAALDFDFTSLGIAPDDFLVYSCFEWQDRKNPNGTMQAFLRAFPAQSDAVLLLKTNPGAAGAAAGALRDIRGDTDAMSRIVLCCEAWDDTRIAALHARGDCYLSLHKGEGWGYPLFEAACRGTPVVATEYAGPLDYLDAKHHWLVRHQSAPVRQAYAYYNPSMAWSEPDVTHAAEGLRWVHAHREEARAAARAAAESLNATFSPREIGKAAKARLTELLADLPRANALPALGSAATNGNGRAQRPFEPVPQPIPGEWYDRDYFETGIKSNWHKGYTWPLFHGVFGDAAACLAELFPAARSFLDVGCAKGFLVRALRERGLEAHGFDHSAWAIERAEEGARPFVRLGDVATIDFDRQFDVTVAMSIFESLTEAQLRAFLPRARRWTQQALFAVVAIPQLQGVPRGDRSQITLRDRDWWMDCFERAGWHQDALHRNFESVAQRHRVPTQMGWNVHVMSACS